MARTNRGPSALMNTHRITDATLHPHRHAADIHKSEVFQVGGVLGVPESTLRAAPSADLWDGQEDENVCG